MHPTDRLQQGSQLADNGRSWWVISVEEHGKDRSRSAHTCFTSSKVLISREEQSVSCCRRTTDKLIFSAVIQRPPAATVSRQDVRLINKMPLSLWLATDVGALGMWDSYEVVRKMHTLASNCFPATLTPHLRHIQNNLPTPFAGLYEYVCAVVNPTLNNRYDDCLSN